MKFIWKDWTKNTGSGIHTDADLARAWVAIIAARFTPLQADKVMRLFSATQSGTVIEGGHVMTYTFHRGPAIDERMFVIEAK